MSEPDKHHYLPVFYLAQWAAPDGKVIRYHRPRDGVVTHPIAPKNTGYERGLYRLDGYAAEQRNAIETEFMSAVVDNDGSQAMQILTAGELGRLTPEIGRAWVRFIMALHVRHPARVDQITEQAAELTRQSLAANPEEYEAVRRVDDPPTLLGWVEKNAPALLVNRGKQLLPGIITHEAIGEIIRHMQWQTVGILGDHLDFLTSDRPLYMSHGISDNRCFIALPISSRVAFLAARDASALQSVLSNGIEAVVNSLNEILVRQAEKFVYAAHDRHLSLVEKYLRLSEAVTA